MLGHVQCYYKMDRLFNADGVCILTSPRLATYTWECMVEYWHATKMNCSQLTYNRMDPSFQSLQLAILGKMNRGQPIWSSSATFQVHTLRLPISTSSCATHMQQLWQKKTV